MIAHILPALANIAFTALIVFAFVGVAILVGAVKVEKR